MARNALYSPAHRVAPRMPLGSGQGAPNQAPSLDFGGAGIQDSRLPWNLANSATAGQIAGWFIESPLIDQVPSAISTTAIAAAQVPVAGTALTLVSSSGAGITVSAAPFLFLPSLLTAPTGTLFIDSQPGYLRWGRKDFTVFYDPTKLISRNLQFTSVGDDHLANVKIVGYDVYGYLVHETVTLTNASVVASKKALKAVISITPGGTLSGSNLSVGQADSYGLPIQAARASALSGAWNNISVLGAGTFTAGVTTNPATATTGDVRGTYLVGSASDGTKRLTLSVGPDIGLMTSQNLPQGLTGVAQF